MKHCVECARTTQRNVPQPPTSSNWVRLEERSGNSISPTAFLPSSTDTTRSVSSGSTMLLFGSGGGEREPKARVDCVVRAYSWKLSFQVGSTVFLMLAVWNTFLILPNSFRAICTDAPVGSLAISTPHMARRWAQLICTTGNQPFLGSNMPVHSKTCTSKKANVSLPIFSCFFFIHRISG